MFPFPVSPIPGVAFALPSLAGAFATPLFTPGVIVALALECAMLVLACIILWNLAGPARLPEAEPRMLLRKHPGRLNVPRATPAAFPRSAPATKAH